MFRSPTSSFNRLQGLLKGSAHNLTLLLERWSAPIVKKCEGTVFGRAGTFLKNVGIDYKEVFTETYHQSKTKPMKFIVYAGIAGLTAYAAVLNPDEVNFRDVLLSNQQKIMLLAEPVRNPLPVQEIRLIEKYYNEGRIRVLSLGIVSIIWLDDHDDKTALYEAQCEYLSPTVSSYFTRVIDIGFWGKWWYLSRYMTDFDINPQEFEPGGGQ